MKHEVEPIGKLIQKYLREECLETPLNEKRLMAAWPDVLGPQIAALTQSMFIKNQVLYVHLNSSVLRQELMMARDLIVRRLNAAVQAQVITNIIFR